MACDFAAHMARTMAVSVVMLLSLGLISAGAVPMAAPDDDAAGFACASHFPAAERAQGIPSGLLSSIAQVESGVNPWAINAEGEGHIFATKAEAIAEVRRLQASGVRSIDVGCMQINLKYHPTAFASLDEAFDPAHNVAYAARFLHDLQETSESWDDAVARYHSGDQVLGGDYRQKVMAAWSGGPLPVGVGGGPRRTSALRAMPTIRISQALMIGVEKVRTAHGTVRLYRPPPLQATAKSSTPAPMRVAQLNTGSGHLIIIGHRRRY
ncbi:MAG TPA: lytic transglycosylase domain-containing protein [Patescibacteria group bacterium]|nr:lytic transglycosylase domain-containing protein [Patescibacteria group bacterium]